jgi:soluble lytic murein transglycosylase
MTIRRFWGLSTPGRLFKATAPVAALAFALALSAQTVDDLARAYRTKPSPQTRAPLQRLAAANTVDGAVAALCLGVTDLENGDLATAQSYLATAQRRLPAIADYTAFWLASAQSQAKEFAPVVPSLEAVWRNAPPSPVAGRAALVGARALLEQNQPGPSLQLLSRSLDQLPQPQGRLLIAKAQEAGGDPVAAAVSYQSIFTDYPTSDEAGEAEETLQLLRIKLGAQYPPLTPQARFARAEKLSEAKQYAQAHNEYESVVPLLLGPEKDTARVRSAAADYNARRTTIALDSLRGLTVTAPEAGAERLYYILACLRRLERDEDVAPYVAEFARNYPTSPWRLKALTMLTARPLVNNETAEILPLLQACADSFAGQPDAALCHWRLTWRAWLDRKPDAVQLLRAHLTLYPGSEKAGAALYYLGRAAEQAGDPAAAKRYFQELPARYPNYYYAQLAATRLKRPEIDVVVPSPAIDALLKTVQWPERPRTANFTPDAITAKRVERARLLARAALDNWSDGELRYAFKVEKQTWPVALELADIAAHRGDIPQALRNIKAYAPGYLYLPRSAAPERFWRYAFPMPYRREIEDYARQHNLDPFLVAGLIRQESEFNTNAISRARALGLMQVLPSTGRQLSRTLGPKPFKSSMLFEPEVNLRHGSYYLKELLDELDGNVEHTLAAYNAGKNRVVKWREWGEFREPSEFAETIPFTETRDYVQIVLRNAQTYRELYQGRPIEDDLQIAKKPAPKVPPPRTSKTAKKSAKTTPKKR